MRYSDGFLRSVLGSTKTIAMVGASTNPNRPSYFAAKYLQSKGFRVIPINPGCCWKDHFGEEVYADLEDLPGDIQVDMVDSSGGQRTQWTTQSRLHALVQSTSGCSLA